MSLQTRFSKVLNNLVIRKHILLTWVYEFRALTCDSLTFRLKRKIWSYSIRINFLPIVVFPLAFGCDSATVNRLRRKKTDALMRSLVIIEIDYFLYKS